MPSQMDRYSQSRPDSSSREHSEEAASVCPLCRIEEGQGGGFSLFDSDLDGALGGFEQRAGAAAGGETLLDDSGDLPGDAGHGVGNGGGQEVAFAETRVLRSVLTTFQQDRKSVV